MLFSENWQNIADYELRICGLFLKTPRFISPCTFLGNMVEIEIYTDACARSAFGKYSINWEYGIGIGGGPSHKRGSQGIPVARYKRENLPLLKE